MVRFKKFKNSEVGLHEVDLWALEFFKKTHKGRSYGQKTDFFSNVEKKNLTYFQNSFFQ